MTVLGIRPLEEKDLSVLNEIRNECREFLHDNREFTLEETQEWFTRLNSFKVKYYAVTSTNPIAAFFGFPKAKMIAYIRTREYTTSKARLLEVGMDLHKNFRGKGLAKAIYRQFFEKKNLQAYEALTLQVLSTNIRAYNLYHNLGFIPFNISNIERDNRVVPSIHMMLRLR